MDKENKVGGLNKNTPCANYTALYSLAIIVPILAYLLGQIFDTEIKPEITAVSVFLVFLFLIFAAKLKDKGYIN